MPAFVYCSPGRDQVVVDHCSYIPDSAWTLRIHTSLFYNDDRSLETSVSELEVKLLYN